MSTNAHKPVALIILDGWGYREETEHNALAGARTPFFDQLWQTYPHTLLAASEEGVGLPAGQIGNSEVGHMTMGTGRVLYTDLVRINKAASEGAFLTNPVFEQLFDHVKKHGSRLHITGLVSPGGIHSHRDHLYAFLGAAQNAGIRDIIIHAILDGRDTPPQSGAQYIEELENILEDVGIGRIATLSGRLYAMDRDNHWERTEAFEKAIFERAGIPAKGQKPSEVLRTLYAEGALDELLPPHVFVDDTAEQAGGWHVADNDAVFFFNFRSDRGRQLSRRIVERGTAHNILLATMTEYDKELQCPVAFPPERPDTCLAAEISRAGLTQAHIAETEKYPHVTYFFNGGRQQPHAGERHVLIESRKDVHTHDEAPAMRAPEIADAAIREISAGTDVLIINFANADMVGHTANVPAIIEAVEETDRQLRRVTEAVLAAGGAALITADHGNAELNFDASTATKHTAHTTNRVPCILTKAGATLSPGGLADIAPTILKNLLHLPLPSAMTGKNLAA